MDGVGEVSRPRGDEVGTTEIFEVRTGVPVGWLEPGQRPLTGPWVLIRPAAVIEKGRQQTEHGHVPVPVINSSTIMLH